jgi:hypothetical protein
MSQSSSRRETHLIGHLRVEAGQLPGNLHIGLVLRGAVRLRHRGHEAQGRGMVLRHTAGLKSPRSRQRRKRRLEGDPEAGRRRGLCRGNGPRRGGILPSGRRRSGQELSRSAHSSVFFNDQKQFFKLAASRVSIRLMMPLRQKPKLTRSGWRKGKGRDPWRRSGA